MAATIVPGAKFDFICYGRWVRDDIMKAVVTGEIMKFWLNHSWYTVVCSIWLIKCCQEPKINKLNC
jgi:hypothetical protein